MLLHGFFADPVFVGDLAVAQAARDGIGHLALAFGQCFDVQGFVRDHGFPLRSGAKLPSYLPKRVSLENRTPNPKPAHDSPATETILLLERVRAGEIGRASCRERV